MESTVKLKKNGFGKRLSSMLKVDMRRMFKTPLLYILIFSCLLMPVAILVMTTMMDGMESEDPQTGEITVIEGFDNVWQIIGSVSSTDMTSGGTPSDDGSEGMGMEMDMLSMCNINMLYFLIAVLVCIFISGDFRSGYAKNLFTVRAEKNDYVISKTLVCFLGGALMILAFFIGSLLGGAISGLSFEMVGFNVANLVLCLICKMLVVSVFVPIFVVMSVASKQKAWLSILLSMGIGMFLFMMIPMISPLNATVMNVILCLSGGAMFSLGLGAISVQVLKKTSLV